MKDVRDDWEVHGFAPLLGVLASPTVEATSTELSGLVSFADALAPFARSLPVTVRDPGTGQPQSSQIALELRDLRTDGFLLSLTVLPPVLHEVLASCSSVETVPLALRAALLRWCEPTDYEALRTFLGVVFVVAAHEEQPLVQLSQLVHAQNSQQHGGTEASNALIPSHCAPPRWFSPTTLKHYILLHDTRRSEDAKVEEIFNQMCTTYGAENCQLLRVDCRGEGLPDAWLDEKSRRQVLERGLNRARSKLIADTGMDAPEVTSMTDSRPGRASTADREAMKAVVSRFAAGPLAGHAERVGLIEEKTTFQTLRSLHDGLVARRGFSKKLTTGMRSWFGTSSAPNLTTAAAVTLSWESAEMQTRRLADLALVFGLAGLAHNNYQSVKKDFQASQALLHYAAAVEMAVVTAHLSNPLLTSRQFPVRYVTDCIDNYLMSTARSTAVLRCALQGVEVLTRYDLHKDAARELVKLTGLDSDILVGAALCRAAESFNAAGWERKAAFYKILAGHRLLRSELKSLVLGAYRAAMPVFVNRGWSFAEVKSTLETYLIQDHIAYLLSCECIQRNPLTKEDARLASDCARLLVRANIEQTPEQQTLFFRHYLTTRAAVTPVLGPEPTAPVPIVDIQKTRVVRGLFPESIQHENEPDDSHSWTELSKSAYYAVEGATTWKGGTPLIADEHTHNTKIVETPVEEPFRIFLHLHNPLGISIRLRNPRLLVLDESEQKSSEAFRAVDNPNEVILTPNETRWLELAVLPTSQVSKFLVEAVEFDLTTIDTEEPSVKVQLTLTPRGRRLNKTPQQQKSVIYAPDERLHAAVSTSTWPRVRVRLAKAPPAPGTMFAGQVCPLLLEVSNEGVESITGISLSTDHAELVTVAEVAPDDGRWLTCHSNISSSNAKVRVFKPVHSLLDQGKTIRLQLALRAPTDKPASVNVLLVCRSASGTIREWRGHFDLGARSLVSVNAQQLDEAHGVIALRLRNELSSRDAALAKVEMLRIRVLSDSSLVLTPLRNRSVQLESEQVDTLCVQVTPSHNEQPFFWINDELRDLPIFPKPVLRRPRTGKVVPKLAVLWKASIVNNDGHVQSLLGESFTVEAFEDMEEEDEGLPEEIEDEAESLSVSFAPLTPVVHDFNVKRLCEVPLRITISNEDPRGRDVELELRFSPRVGDESQPWQSLPLEARTQLWTSRVLKARLAMKESKSFKLPLRISRPSVYDDLNVALWAKFDGDHDQRLIPLPRPPVVIVHAQAAN